MSQPTDTFSMTVPGLSCWWRRCHVASALSSCRLRTHKSSELVNLALVNPACCAFGSAAEVLVAAEPCLDSL